MNDREHIAIFARESVWGTDPGSSYTTLLLGDEGLNLRNEPELVAVPGNDAWPHPRSQEVVGMKAAGSYKIPLYIDSAQSLIKMAFDRDATYKDLYGYTLKRKDRFGEAVVTGAKAQSATIEWSANGLVTISLEFTGKKYTYTAAANSISAGTYPTGMPYKGARLALTVNSAAQSSVESGRIGVANNLDAGPYEGADLTIGHLDAGDAVVTGSFKVKFASAAFEAFVAGLTNGDLTAFPAVLTFGNQTGVTAKNLVLTFPAGTLKASSANREKGQGGTVMQSLEVVHAGTAPTWTYAA